ncbi:DUF1249 domain-containing protein [Neiella litorisoli]|nr:DUF1249 domain-containing protein [Neiella litorisoli]
MAANQAQRQLNNKRYVPSISELHACCARNYASLTRLINGLAGEATMTFSQAGETLGLDIEDEAPYTTTIRLTQRRQGMPKYLAPTMQVRLYHDARMAEVLSCQQICSVRASYDYPNIRMHQRDEKMQLNQFLAEWIEFCLDHGVGSNNELHKKLINW